MPLQSRLHASPRAAAQLDRTRTIDDIAQLVEKGFAAAKDDIADLKIDLKGDIARLQQQVNSIETELKHGRSESRLGNLDE